MTGTGDPTTPAPTTLRVVRGEPDPLELAALVAVITAATSAVEEAPAEPPAESRWATPDRLLRPAVHPSGWWASALPR